jgi:elongation factor 3
MPASLDRVLTQVSALRPPQNRFAPDEVDDGTEGELLCNIQFSLAYGGLLLLNHTKLKLYRGHRYGVCAGNGKGKSTLLKAIRDGKVEGFPSQDELKTIMVEHALQGEDTGSSIIDFIASGASRDAGSQLSLFGC